MLPGASAAAGQEPVFHQGRPADREYFYYYFENVICFGQVGCFAEQKLLKSFFV